MISTREMAKRVPSEDGACRVVVHPSKKGKISHNPRVVGKYLLQFVIMCINFFIANTNISCFM